MLDGRIHAVKDWVGERLAGTVFAAPIEYAIDTLYGLRHPTLLASGATREEEVAALPGDQLIPTPMWQATRAETIHGPAAAVWPWLVQMGWDRGGWYAWSYFDPQGKGSARRISKKHQQLRVGDVLLDGPGCHERKGAWTVKSVEPGRAIVLHSLRDPISGRELEPRRRGSRFIDCAWSFVLDQVDQRTSRLVVRTRVTFGPRWASLPMRMVFGPGDTVWQRMMLRGIKERAERAPRRTGRRTPTVPVAPDGSGTVTGAA
ncbi:MAG TPA: hypothetical protein VK977_07785 [Actinomycetota bacterium]|nr:hypothetical protein [Actinomycetota bacterium]